MNLSEKKLYINTKIFTHAHTGPFKDSDMCEWFKSGYFERSLMLKAGLEGEFVSLGGWGGGGSSGWGGGGSSGWGGGDSSG